MAYTTADAQVLARVALEKMCNANAETLRNLDSSVQVETAFADTCQEYLWAYCEMVPERERPFHRVKFREVTTG